MQMFSDMSFLLFVESTLDGPGDFHPVHHVQPEGGHLQLLTVFVGTPVGGAAICSS